MCVFRALCFSAIVMAASASHAAEAPFTLSELKTHTFELAEKYFEQFQDSKTFVLYGARLSTKETWTTPQQIKSRKPAPWGYGSRIADTALHCGHTLVALLDANDAAPDPYLRGKAEELFSALRFIGGICPVEGLVPRGIPPMRLKRRHRLLTQFQEHFQSAQTAASVRLFDTYQQQAFDLMTSGQAQQAFAIQQ